MECEYFIEQLLRWERTTINGISSECTEIKVIGSDSWHNIYSEVIAAPNTHIDNDLSLFPNGIDTAIQVMKDNIMSECPIKRKDALQIFHQLQLTSDFIYSSSLNVIKLLREMYKRPVSIENRRYNDVILDIYEGSFINKSNDRCINYSLCMKDTLQYNNNNNNNMLLFENLSDAKELLLQSDIFQSYDNSIEENQRALLELANNLECKALVCQNSKWQKLLYAEAAVLIENVSLTDNISLRNYCYCKLAKQYVLGHGIYVSDLPLRDTADIQAYEYLMDNNNPTAQTILAIMLSSGRLLTERDKILGEDTQNVIVTKLLTEAINNGCQLATFWYAKLIFEGWGEHKLKIHRIHDLIKAKELFGLCVVSKVLENKSKYLYDLIDKMMSTRKKRYESYWKDIIASIYKLLVRNSAKLDLCSNSPPRLLKDNVEFYRSTYEHLEVSWGMLAIHIFQYYLVGHIMKDVKKALYKVIRNFASRNNHCGPLGALDSSFATWVTEILNRLLPINYENWDIQNDNIQKYQDLNLWLRQMFNKTFLSGGMAWDREATQLLLEKIIDKVIIPVQHINSFYSGVLPPFEEAISRIESAKLCTATSDVKKIWKKCLIEAEIVYLSIDSLDRDLKEQTTFFTDVNKLLSSHSINFSRLCNGLLDEVNKFSAACKIIYLSRNLRRKSRQNDNLYYNDCLDQYTLSAIAILQYARENGIDTSTAMNAIRDNYKSNLSCNYKHNGYDSRIRYDVVIEEIRIKVCKERNIQNIQFMIERRENFLFMHRAFNEKWRSSLDKSLLIIFDRFKKHVAERMTMSKTWIETEKPLPILNVKAITFEDPWMLHFIDIDDSLKYLYEELISSTDTTNSKSIEYNIKIDDILTNKINNKVSKLKYLSNSILYRVNQGSDDLISRIQLKKKFLFLLENIPDIDWTTPSCITLVTAYLNEGLSGRCCDGINSFCDNFIRQYSERANTYILDGLPQYFINIVLSISGLMYKLKIIFMKKHISRAAEAIEGRTVGFITLQNMLMLPLGLPGEYSCIQYPSFATTDHVNSTQMMSCSICPRFLDGGLIEFSYGERVYFSRLTVSYIVNLVRSLICKGNANDEPIGENNIDEYVLLPHVEKDIRKLLPRAKLTHIINEDFVEEFCRNDILIAPYYQEALLNEYNKENLFFKALCLDEYRQKSILAVVIKDSVIVRILEATEYVEVPRKFWNDLDMNWTANICSTY